MSEDLEREHLAPPGWRTFLNIAAAWRLTSEQRCDLLGLDPTAFDRLHETKGAGMANETLTRISYVFGIYKALHTLLPVPERADEWIHAPNSAACFGGRTAVEAMTSGRTEDLAVVRSYLDAQLF